MNKLLIPLILYTYSLCAGIFCLFSPTLLYMFFGGKPLNILLPVLLLWVVAAVCDGFYIGRMNKKRRRSKIILRELLRVRGIQIPAYVIVIVSIIYFSAEVPLISVGLIILAYMSQLLAALACSYALIRSYDHETISLSRCVVGVFFQFIPVADIIVNAVTLSKVRKVHRRRRNTVEYVVKRISGEYAYLADKQGKEVFVALHLLPEGACEGTELYYNMVEYTLKKN